MKLYDHCFFVLIVLIVVSSGKCGSLSSKNSIENISDNKNKDSHETLYTTKKTFPIREQKEELFQKQLRALAKLGCKPRRFKVPSRSLIEPTSPVADKDHVYPEYVIVQKCDKECSFCRWQQDRLGIENKVCMATFSKKKTFIVKYFSDNSWKFAQLKAEEDKLCECKDKEFDLW